VVGTQAVVVWHSSHWIDVTKCVGGFPVAEVPLWQDEQLPETEAWSKLVESQLPVVWQSSHGAEVAICVDPLPVAVVPLWHDEHVPITAPWSIVTGIQPEVE
jgi:hypothetical protein